MAEEKKLLEIENLRKYFPVNGIKGPGVQAVQDVSLYIKKYCGFVQMHKFESA